MSALDMPLAWDINPGGSGDVIVAVVDSGITSVNRTFAAQTWDGRAIQSVAVPFRSNPDLSLSRLYRPWDFLSGGDIVLDLVGHGTHVSGTIGQDANAIAQLGIAYNVRIMPVKVCFGFWDVQFAFSAAGRPGFAPGGIGGCDVVAIAAGIRYAADNGAHVINLSLGGPGQSRTARDAIAYVAGMIWQAGLREDDFDEARVIAPRFDRYVESFKIGTSMAAPHVAGLAALIVDQGVTNPAAVEALLRRTARRLGESDPSRTGWNSEFGYGLIQPRAALRGFAIAR